MDQGPKNGDSISIPLLDGNHDGHKQPPVRGDESNASLGSTSFWKTCLNGLNALSGVGILSLPFAVSSGGWLSLILLFIVATAGFYTGLLIKRCMDMDSTIRTYPDIGGRAFGAKGRAIVSILMNVELYMVATGFIILEGDNFSHIFPNVGIEVGGFTIGARQSFVLMIGLILIPTVWFNDMSILAYVSAGGIAASVILLCSIFWTGAFDGIGFHAKGKLVDWSGIPTAVSLYAFCYCAHPVFPTIYTSMRNPRHFSKVMALCFSVCTFIYGLVAVFGYLMFGSNVVSQITLNLPTNKISSKVAIYTTLINPIAKYALMVTPIVNGIESRLLFDGKKIPVSLLIRTCLVVSTLIIALLIPSFANLMSLVGAFLSITASIILPCSCFLKISGIYRRFGFEMMIITGITLMGVAIMITGTYIAVLELIRQFVS